MSEFDKFESFLIKEDTALYMQNKVACKDGMEIVKNLYGPFDREEVDFYKRRLKDSATNCTINAFQRDMIFNLFFQYFQDPQTLNAINLDDYVTLIIAAKRILEASGMILLPYIVSAKISRLAFRKTVNKKETTKLESSHLYAHIKEKYKSDKIEKYILGLIATILSSDFEIIDPNDSMLDGARLNVVPELVGEEILMYISLI